MKKIEAIIKPPKLDEVKSALREVDNTGLTVAEVRGFARQKGHTEVYYGAEPVVDFLPKVKIEVAVDDALLIPVVAVIAQAARAAMIGNGKAFVSDIQKAIRIRTGERGAAAV